jgi:hypothetical protein
MAKIWKNLGKIYHPIFRYEVDYDAEDGHRDALVQCDTPAADDAYLGLGRKSLQRLLLEKDPTQMPESTASGMRAQLVQIDQHPAHAGTTIRDLRHNFVVHDDPLRHVDLVVVDCQPLPALLSGSHCLHVL